MTNFIPINLAVEDQLSETVVREILKQSQRPFVIGNCYSCGGYGYLKKNINGFNNSAKGTPFFVLTDLDRGECPLELIEEWLSYSKHPNLLFRIAVREVEAWLFADREAFANFLGIRVQLIPDPVDQIDDPKRLLIHLASQSKNRELREAIVPSPRSTSQIGKGYNYTLNQFVTSYWRMEVAIQSSPSLKRTVNAIMQFNPTWQ